MAKRFKACSVDGCNGSAHTDGGGARGWCSMHVQRWRKHGTPLGIGNTSRGQAREYLEKTALPYQGGECLIWPFSRNQWGYGTTLRPDGKHWLVSRYICTALHGEPPSPKYEAAHSCGNGHLGCVTPSHLSWKTPLENSADKFIHGTTRAGERSPNAKLSEMQVKEIMSMRETATSRYLAKVYGVGKTTISAIWSGKKWGSVTMAGK